MISCSEKVNVQTQECFSIVTALLRTLKHIGSIERLHQNHWKLFWLWTSQWKQHFVRQSTTFETYKECFWNHFQVVLNAHELKNGMKEQIHCYIIIVAPNKKAIWFDLCRFQWLQFAIFHRQNVWIIYWEKKTEKIPFIENWNEHKAMNNLFKTQIRCSVIKKYRRLLNNWQKIAS